MTHAGRLLREDSPSGMQSADEQVALRSWHTTLVGAIKRHLDAHDPDRASLQSAARAALVIPPVFAFADNVIGNPQTTIFSVFGSFSLLVLADFQGTPRRRLTAYLALATLGLALIVLGTVCSRSALAGACTMAVVGFAILFSGLINRYCAAGAFAALLCFILSVNVPRSGRSPTCSRRSSMARLRCRLASMRPMTPSASCAGGLSRPPSDRRERPARPRRSRS